MILPTVTRPSAAWPTTSSSAKKRCAAKAKLGPDDPDTLASMNNLASATAVGRYADALKLHRRDLCRGRISVLAKDHPEMLLAMNSLANAYILSRSLRRRPQAVAKKRWLFTSRKPGPRPSRHARAACKSGQQLRLRPLCRSAQAPPGDFRSCAAAKLGPDHPATLLTMGHLAGESYEARPV